MKKKKKNIKNVNKSIINFNVKKKENLSFDYKENSTRVFPKTLIKSQLISKDYPFTLYVKVVRNNIFCTFTNTYTGNIILKINSGVYKIKISKKTLRFYLIRIINLFLKEKSIKKNIFKTNKNILLNIKASSRLKIKILKQIINSSLKKSVAVVLPPLKCFNGCKVSKLRRKKRRGFRVFK